MHQKKKINKNKNQGGGGELRKRRPRHNPSSYASFLRLLGLFVIFTKKK
jgi:hypothetical protein